MKFDSLFKNDNHKLIRICDGKEIDCSKLKIFNSDKLEDLEKYFKETESEIAAVNLLWEEVDLGDGNYNEEKLALMHNKIKEFEEVGKFLFIIPKTSKKIQDSDDAETYIKTMVHAARRLKDCISIIGFALPAELLEKDSESQPVDLGENSWSRWFVNEMNIKHSHYVYFAENSVLQQFQLDAEFSKTDYILY